MQRLCSILGFCKHSLYDAVENQKDEASTPLHEGSSRHHRSLSRQTAMLFGKRGQRSMCSRVAVKNLLGSFVLPYRRPFLRLGFFFFFFFLTLLVSICPSAKSSSIMSYMENEERHDSKTESMSSSSF